MSEVTKAVRKEKLKEMCKILQDAGIRMSVGSCGCCSSSWITFEYNGELLLDDIVDADFDMFGDQQQVKPTGGN